MKLEPTARINKEAGVPEHIHSDDCLDRGIERIRENAGFLGSPPPNRLRAFGADTFQCDVAPIGWLDTADANAVRVKVTQAGQTERFDHIRPQLAISCSCIEQGAQSSARLTTAQIGKIEVTIDDWSEIRKRATDNT